MRIRIIRKSRKDNVLPLSALFRAYWVTLRNKIFRLGYNRVSDTDVCAAETTFAKLVPSLVNNKCL
ncbi:hypothetical protein ACFLUU_05900 [Chloroflexota bacterium]